MKLPTIGVSITTFKSIRVKKKKSSIFMLIIEAINKNKVPVDAMNQINVVQLDI